MLVLSPAFTSNFVHLAFEASTTCLVNVRGTSGSTALQFARSAAAAYRVNRGNVRMAARYRYDGDRREGGGAGARRASEGQGKSRGSAVYTGPGFRVVRCFPRLARREADKAVSDGRVTVNGVVVAPSWRVRCGDVVRLDGKVAHWEELAEAAEGRAADDSEGSFTFSYAKYYKPTGITCTTDVHVHPHSLNHPGASPPLCHVPNILPSIGHVVARARARDQSVFWRRALLPRRTA